MSVGTWRIRAREKDLAHELGSREKEQDPVRQTVDVGPDVGFPNAHNPPPEPLERARHMSIASSVA